MKKTKVVSFSGGRTSAYLVHLMEQKRKDGEDVHYVFMDTGAEHPKTYEFVRNIINVWSVPVTCLRLKINPELGNGNSFTVVSADEIVCDLKPWKDMLSKYGVPYTGGMFCTDRMKLGPFKKYCDEKFGRGNYETWLGIRADEQRRLKRKDGISYLADISDFEKQDVLNWWSEQDFDLNIDEWLGNCVFCPKKSDLKLAAAAIDEPELMQQFIGVISSDNVRLDENTGSINDMYRRHRRLESVIAMFDGVTGEEIKSRIRGRKMTDTGSCSESCEAFSFDEEVNQ